MADGAYAKRPFLRAVMARGATVVSRLRKDAALRSVPKPQKRRRGRATYSYDSRGNLRSRTNQLGRITTNIYDPQNRVIAIVDPLGHRTSYAYNYANLPLRMQDPLNRITTNVYDNACRIIAQIDALGRRTSYAYDSRSNVISVKNALGRLTTAIYDNLNRFVALVDPLANRSTNLYDSSNRRIAWLNPPRLPRGLRPPVAGFWTVAGWDCAL